MIGARWSIRKKILRFRHQEPFKLEKQEIRNQFDYESNDLRKDQNSFMDISLL